LIETVGPTAFCIKVAAPVPTRAVNAIKRHIRNAEMGIGLQGSKNPETLLWLVKGRIRRIYDCFLYFYLRIQLLLYENRENGRAASAKVI
jgi:hypothetical protein